MNKLGNKESKLLATGLIIAITLLAACSPTNPVTACHATGDSANPYEKITITQDNLKEHLSHPNDIYPVPEGGCPTSSLAISTDGSIAICHATSNKTNPYNKITVKVNGLGGHGAHPGDIIPMPEAGCPTGLLAITNGMLTVCRATDNTTDPYGAVKVQVNALDRNGMYTDLFPVPKGGCPISPPVVSNTGTITICHATTNTTNPGKPYDQILVKVLGLGGHGADAGDIIPMPKAGCPTIPLVISNTGTISVCRATSNSTEPYTVVTVQVNALDRNGMYTDIYPVPQNGCPTIPLVISNTGTITICHATTDPSKPYDQILVTVLGLGGHGTDPGDIIPMPPTGCPTKTP